MFFKGSQGPLRCLKHPPNTVKMCDSHSNKNLWVFSQDPHPLITVYLIVFIWWSDFRHYFLLMEKHSKHPFTLWNSPRGEWNTLKKCLETLLDRLGSFRASLKVKKKAQHFHMGERHAMWGVGSVIGWLWPVPTSVLRVATGVPRSSVMPL